MKITLVASGDLRESANQVCWAKQAEMEEALAQYGLVFGHTDLGKLEKNKEKVRHGNP